MLCRNKCSLFCEMPFGVSSAFLLLLLQVRFQHEVYPQISAVSRPAVDQPVSRQVFSVQDLEIRDRLATSQMNKFLYLYSSKEMPRKAHSNMVRKAPYSW